MNILKSLRIHDTMLYHYLTLRALAGEWNTILKGAVVAEVFTQTKNELLVSFNPVKPSPLAGRIQEGAALSISVEPKFTCAVLRESVSRARRNSVDLFDSLPGQSVTECSIHPSDRTIRIGFQTGAALHLRLYGTAGNNILLTDGHHLVIGAFKNQNELKGTLYEEPADTTSLLRDANVFREKFLNVPGKNVVTALRQTIPVLGALYAREIVFRCGLEAEKQPADCTDSETEHLRSGILSLFEEAGYPEPVLYRLQDGTLFLAILPLHLTDVEKIKEFQTVNDAVAGALEIMYRSRSLSGRKSTVLEKIIDARTHFERALEKTARQPQEDPEEYERSGKLVLMHIDKIKKGMTELAIPDVLGNGGMVRIALDPRLAPAGNAERYFEKAKNRRRDRKEQSRRVEEIRDKISRLSVLENVFESCLSGTDIARRIEEYSDELNKLGLIEEVTGKERPPFRIFTVAGGYEVWVGKNSANNDLLTQRYARPNDIWMHARGASGSHTVLRVGQKDKGPPREAIEQAAAIAAYYSKMRNAKHVPVAYCERKYVRKVKRSPEGTVTLEREEIIFVTPRLP